MNSSFWAAVAACLSLVSILINIHYNRKIYRGNLEVRSKLNLLSSLRKLVPEFIAAVDYTSYVYDKAEANDNDRKAKQENKLEPGVKYSNINFDDYSQQLSKANAIYYNLQAECALQNEDQLSKDAKEIWSCLDSDNLNKSFANSTNGRLSEGENAFNVEFNRLSQKMTTDFISLYEEQFKKLVK